MPEATEEQLFEIIKRLCDNTPFNAPKLLGEIQRVVRGDLAYYVKTDNGYIQILNASSETEAKMAAQARGFDVSEVVFETDFTYKKEDAHSKSIKLT